MIKNILLVCMGNICRSPMAEGIFSHHITSQNVPLKIISAGICACVGQSAHSIAQALMLEKGIDISHHKARQLTAEMLVLSDLILVMEEIQIQMVTNQFQFIKGRIHTLGKWSKFEVPDPLNRSVEEFKIALELIEQGSRDWQLKIGK